MLMLYDKHTFQYALFNMCLEQCCFDFTSPTTVAVQSGYFLFLIFSFHVLYPHCIHIASTLYPYCIHIGQDQILGLIHHGDYLWELKSVELDSTIQCRYE
jgi:hypothetical protein